ncbi:hypothetical protein ACX9NE_25425 [Mycobacterium sp. ML4]
MAPEPPFIVTFRGREIGRHETAESAMAAARSVIDTELGRQLGRPPESIPPDLPRIEWQPPRVPFPFDAPGYWHWRARALRSERRPPTAPGPVHVPSPPSPPGPPPPPEHVLPPGRDEPRPIGPTTVYEVPVPPVPSPPAPVYGGSPPIEEPESGRRRWFGKGHD